MHERSLWVLLLTLVLFGLYCYWLSQKSIDEAISEAIFDYEILVLDGKYQEASDKVAEVIPGGAGPLDKMWLPLIRLNSNAYDRISLYLRVIVSDAEYELPYEIVAQLLESSPPDVRKELRRKVSGILSGVPELRLDLADKYHLLASD